MKSAAVVRPKEDSLLCPRCFEAGRAAALLVQIRPARRPENLPYALRRRHRCPVCAASFVSVERLRFAAIRRAVGVEPTAQPPLEQSHDQEPGQETNQDEPEAEREKEA